MATEFKFPDVGEGITEGEVVLWLVEEGERIEQDQPMVQVETDKAVVEIPSPRAGVILKILFREGEIVKVGQTLVVIGEEGERFEEPVKEEPKEEKKEYVGIVGQVQDVAGKAPAESRALAVPAVRKLAKDLGVDINKVKGGGPGGRITEEDVRRFAEREQVTADQDSYGEIERVTIMRVRRSVAQKMARSAASIPHVTHMDLADATKLVQLKRKKMDEARSKNIHLTYLPFIMRAVALSLKKHPYLNSSIDTERNEILLKKYINIGFAVETGDGLLVPVVKNVDAKSVFDLAEETQRLADLTRERKVALPDLKGGSFSITNIGSMGGIFSTPIINHPEAANLGVGKIREIPWVIDGEIKIISGLYLSLSFDHRILDGAEGARFLNAVIEYVENPEKIL